MGSSLKATNAEFFRRYFSPQSGILCMIFGIMLVICGIIVLLVPRRVAMFWYLIGVGIFVFVLGITLFIIRCFCPQIIPERRKCERCLCRCVP